MSVDLSNYSDILGTDANASIERAALQSAINSALSPVTGGTYVVSLLGGPRRGFQIYDSTDSHTVTDIGTAIQFTPGESLSVGSATDVGQTPFGEPLSTSTTLNLNGLTSTNLASSLLSQLGGASGSFTVSYASGALSIGISSTGTTAGMVSIASSANTVQETIPDNMQLTGNPVFKAIDWITHSREIQARPV